MRTIVNPHLYSDVFERLIRHPTLLSAAQRLLDDEVYVFQMGVNNKASFNGDVWFWHQDFPGYHHDDHIPTPNMVNTLIFLDEVNMLNGPLMIVPGSYRHVPARPRSPTKGLRTPSATPTTRRSPNWSAKVASSPRPGRRARRSSCTSTRCTDRRPTFRRGPGE